MPSITIVLMFVGAIFNSVCNSLGENIIEPRLFRAWRMTFLEGRLNPTPNTTGVFTKPFS